MKLILFYKKFKKKIFLYIIGEKALDLNYNVKPWCLRLKSLPS